MPKILSTAFTALRALPDKLFYQADKETPNYNRAFAEVCREVFKGHLKSANDLIEAIGSGDQLNLSSWQRMCANEAVHRRGGKLKDGSTPAKKKKAPKSVPTASMSALARARESLKAAREARSGKTK